MDGLEVVELKLSEVLEDNKSFRFDSEYFKKEYLALQKQIYNYPHKQLGDFSKVTDGEHGSVIFQKNGIKYLTAENIKKGIVDISNIRYVTKEVDERNKRASVKVGDILISIKGTLGEVAIAEPWLLPANMNRDVAIIKNKYKNDFLDGYIVLFLMSKIGNKLSERLGSGGVQQMITLERLRTLMIPKLSNNIQNKVSYLYELSRKKLEDSKTLYKEAENLLLEELNLLDFKPTKESISIKSFSESFGSSGRLDSEYYLPKYDEVDKKFEKYKKIKLNKLVKYSISSGATPKAGGADYTDKKSGIPFIRAVNIIDSKVEFDNVLFVKDYVHNKKLKKTKLKENDVLFSIAGTVGRCGISYYKKEANINQAVAILRFDDNIIRRLYLILFFNSEIGKLYISKYSRQGLQTNLNLDEIGNLEIPIIDYTLQTQIESKIKESFRLKEESKRLLELAKRSVEVAIEEGEDRAMRLIKERGL